VDTEFAYDWYLDKTDESKTSYVIKPHICKLLGITRSPATVLCVQTQDINVVKGFFFAAGQRPDVVGVVHDTITVNWDLLSDSADDSLPGGLKWAGPKKVMRRLQYQILAAQKHYVCCAPTAIVYDKDMNVVGSGPHLESPKQTAMQRWFDFIGEVKRSETQPVPTMTVRKERSGGVVGLGQVIEAPTFAKLLALLGEGPHVDLTVEAGEMETAARVAMLDAK